MSSSPGTQETKVEPWSGAQPHITEFMKRARGFLDDPQQMYPGEMSVQPSQLTGAAMERARNFMNIDTADDLRAFAGEAMGGFASNPMLDQTYDAAAEGVTRNFQRVTQPGIESAYARAGRGSSSAAGRSVGVAQGELADSLGDLASQFYYSDYENRMGDRFRGAALLGEADRMEAGQIGIMSAGGATQEGYEQQRLNELLARFNFGQQEPQQRLDQYGQRVGGISQGFSQSTTSGIEQGGNPGLAIGLGLMSALATVFSAGTAAPAVVPLATAGIGALASTYASGAGRQQTMPGLPAGGFHNQPRNW